MSIPQDFKKYLQVWSNLYISFSLSQIKKNALGIPVILSNPKASYVNSFCVKKVLIQTFDPIIQLHKLSYFIQIQSHEKRLNFWDKVKVAISLYFLQFSMVYIIHISTFINCAENYLSKLKDINDKNFYVLKIHLNYLKSLIKFWNLKIWFRSENLI